MHRRLLDDTIYRSLSIAVIALLSGMACADESPPVPATSCAGAWIIDTPTRGQRDCPFADPHTLSFSVAGETGRAQRITGEHVTARVIELFGTCVATITHHDRFSDAHGPVTLQLRAEGDAIAGAMSRSCSDRAVPLRGRRRADPLPAADPLPTWRLRRAYSTLLEQCALTHDMAASTSSRLTFSIAANGALTGLSRDGVPVDLTACPEHDGMAAHARAGFLGHPGQPGERRIVLAHRTPDELGVGPLLLGASKTLLPGFGFRRSSAPAGSVWLEQEGARPPESMTMGGSWLLHSGDEVVLEVRTSGDRRVQRIRGPVLETPAHEPLGAFLDLGVSAGEVLALLDGWLAPGDGPDRVFRGAALVPIADGTPDPVTPVSPCAVAIDGEVITFAGRDTLFWDRGGRFLGDRIVLCAEADRSVFEVRPGAPTRAYVRGRPWGPDLWYRDRGWCQVELDDRLHVECHRERQMPWRFRTEGDALIPFHGLRSTWLARRARRVDSRAPAPAHSEPPAGE